MEVYIEVVPVNALAKDIPENEKSWFAVYVGGHQYISIPSSGVVISHLPTKIEARSSERRAINENYQMALMLLQSRLFAHYAEQENFKLRYAYLWDSKQVVDRQKRELYPLNQSYGLASVIIKSLETSSKFQGK